MAKTTRFSHPFPDRPEWTGSETLLGIIMKALWVAQAVPAERPSTRFPAHLNRDNMEALNIEERPGGCVANLVFHDTPAGLPDVIGTPEARPLASADEAFLAGAELVCEIVTGSPKLPFVLTQNALVFAVNEPGRAKAS